MMTPESEHADLVGKAVLVPWPRTNALVRCMVLKTGKQYGNDQILVSPDAGSGSFWVRSWRVVEEEDFT